MDKTQEGNEHEGLDLALAEAIAKLLEREAIAEALARETALNLVEIVTQARLLEGDLRRLRDAGPAGSRDGVDSLYSTITATLLEIADHSRDSYAALEAALEQPPAKHRAKKARKKQCGWRRSSGA